MSPQKPSPTSDTAEALAARAYLTSITEQFEEWLAAGGNDEEMCQRWQNDITLAARRYCALLRGEDWDAQVIPEPRSGLRVVR